MASLEADFERKAEAAFLDDVGDKDPGQVLADAAEENFKIYASQFGYDISHIWQDAEITTTRSGDTIETRIEWPELTALFEYGVDPHVIEGNLAFEWDGPPQGTRPEGAPEFVQTSSVNWGSVTGGIAESRAIRNAIRSIRAQMQARGPGGQFR